MGLYITIRSNKRLKNNSKDGSYFKYYGFTLLSAVILSLFLMYKL